MKIFSLAACLLLIMSAAPTWAAEEMPPMPKPTKEHGWLNQLVGEWEYDAEITMAPDTPPMKTSGTETIRSIGGFWTVAENKGEAFGKVFTGILTLGYSPESSKYVGTWIDSMQDRMWQYQGSLDSTGKILTLNTEGPCPMQGNKIAKVQEILEIKGPDAKSFTSKVDFDGKWVQTMTINYRRKK